MTVAKDIKFSEMKKRYALLSEMIADPERKFTPEENEFLLKYDPRDVQGILIARYEEALTALADMFAMIDEGWLVRNTDYDGKPGFAARELPYIARLKTAHGVLEAEERSFEVSQEQVANGQ